MIRVSDTHQSIAPKYAVNKVLLETLLPHRNVGLQKLGMDIVPEDRAVLHEADQRLVVGPRHADQPAPGVLPHGLRDQDAGGVENPELAEGGLGVELDDLGVVADHGDGAAEGGAGDLVAAEVDVLPPHRVELGLAVVAVVEEQPLRRDGHVRHQRETEPGAKGDLGLVIRGASTGRGSKDRGRADGRRHDRAVEETRSVAQEREMEAAIER